MLRSLIELQGAGKEVPSFGQDSAEFSENADKGSARQILMLQPGNGDVNALAVS